MTIRIAVTGASGRMGRTILENILSDAETAIAGGCDRPGLPHIGKDIGLFLGHDLLNQTIEDTLEKTIKSGTDAIIDFTAPEATLANAQVAAAARIPLVIGTTGFDDAQKQKIKAAAAIIPIVMAPNMSVGVNVLFKLIADAAKILGEGYDIEVIEAHHRLKKDAPSGTAVRMGEILAETSGRHYPQDAVFHREGITGPRTDREIGMQTIRGGDIVGNHTAMFCGIGERVEITHIATSRDTFGKGAIRAAKWLQGKAPGLYDMQDVLGIR